MGRSNVSEEIIVELKYPAHTIIDCDTEVLAASWFHLHLMNQGWTAVVCRNSGDGEARLIKQ